MRPKPTWHAYARELRDQGKTVDEIAAIVGRHRASVHRVLDHRNAITGVCECGCGGVTSVNVVTWKPYRYILGHRNRLPDDKLWRVLDSGCWQWTGSMGHRGYGSVCRDGHNKAHRWAYEHFVGPIPDGMQLDHLCRNRACVNPAHLEPVTPTENVRRGLAAKLTWNDVQAMRASTLSPGDLARQYGIGVGYVRAILRYRSWAEPSERRDG